MSCTATIEGNSVLYFIGIDNQRLASVTQKTFDRSAPMIVVDLGQLTQRRRFDAVLLQQLHQLLSISLDRCPPLLELLDRTLLPLQLIAHRIEFDHRTLKPSRNLQPHPIDLLFHLFQAIINRDRLLRPAAFKQLLTLAPESNRLFHHPDEVTRQTRLVLGKIHRGAE